MVGSSASHFSGCFCCSSDIPNGALVAQTELRSEDRPVLSGITASFADSYQVDNPSQVKLLSRVNRCSHLRMAWALISCGKKVCYYAFLDVKYRSFILSLNYFQSKTFGNFLSEPFLSAQMTM